MEHTTHVAGWVDRIEQLAVQVTDQMLAEGCGVQPPTVHVLIDGLDPASVGSLTCRRFYRGRDAHRAVAVMGLLGSMLGASRLVVTYEHADLATALQDPRAAEAPTGVVVLEADRDAHAVRWHPVLMTEAPPATAARPRSARSGGRPRGTPTPRCLRRWRSCWPCGGRQGRGRRPSS